MFCLIFFKYSKLFFLNFPEKDDKKRNFLGFLEQTVLNIF